MKQLARVILSCMLICSSSIYSQTPREIDSLALVALYNSTKGASWINNTNWLDPVQTIDTWYGITVVGNRVSQLVLSDNMLNGTLPVDIGNLTELVTLNCSGNMLAGALPIEIGNLTLLQSCDLQNNIFNGFIPSSIGNLTNLQSLDLNQNRLTGLIPSEIENLSLLLSIFLQSNQLSGSIPSSIGNLSQLVELLLDDNKISDIPIEITNLTNITNFGIKNNQLCNIEDPSIISWLTSHDADWNSFQRCLSDALVFKNELENVSMEINFLGNLYIDVPILENQTPPATGGLIFKRNDVVKAALTQQGLKIAGEKQSPFTGDFPTTAITIAKANWKQAGISEEGDLLVRNNIIETNILSGPNMIRNIVSQVPDDENPITATRYYDGRLNNIQTQVKLTDSRSLITGNYYSRSDKIEKSIKPFPYNTTDYEEMLDLFWNQLLIPYANVYHGSDYAFSQNIYDCDPLERIREMGAPGENYSLDQDHHPVVWYFGIPGALPVGDEDFASYFDGDVFIHCYLLNTEDLEDIKAFLESYEPDFFLEVVLDPNGNYSQQIKNKFGQVVRTWSNPSKVYDQSGDEEIIREYYRYDNLGNLLEAIPPSDNSSPPNDIGTTRFKYNTARQMLQETTPDAGTIEITYNNVGLVSTSTSADGKVLTYNYDRFRRLISTSYNGNNYSMNFYDNKDNLSDISSYLKPEYITAFETIKNDLENLNGRQCGALSIEYLTGSSVDKDKCVVDLISYNAHGRIVAEYKCIPQVGWQKVSYKYNIADNVTEKDIHPQYLSGVTYPDISFEYEYDNLGRLSKMKNAEGKTIIEQTYSEIGLLAQKKFFNKATQTASTLSDYEYNIRDWIEMVNYTVNGSDVFTENPSYYAPYYDGTISSEQFNFKDIGKNITLSYTYDGINRLTSVLANSAYEEYSEAFKYDAIGRMVQRRRGSHTLESFTQNYYKYYTGNNRLKYITDIHSNTDNYTWDDNGNMLTDDSKKMQITYDWSQMKKSILLNEGTQQETEVTMVYDVAGSRVLKTERIDVDQIGVVYIDNEIVYEDNNDGSGYQLSYVNIIGPSGVEGRIDFESGVEISTLYYIRDRKGSTRAVVSEDGVIPKEYMYFAYGTLDDLIMSPSDAEPREKFTGKEFDSEGGMDLYYFGARYQDAEAGMFTSPDPMRQYWNLYSYTGGNPVMFVDPTGMVDEPAPEEDEPNQEYEPNDIIEMPPIDVIGKLDKSHLFDPNFSWQGGANSQVGENFPEIPLKLPEKKPTPSTQQKAEKKAGEEAQRSMPCVGPPGECDDWINPAQMPNKEALGSTGIPGLGTIWSSGGSGTLPPAPPGYNFKWIQFISESGNIILKDPSTGRFWELMPENAKWWRHYHTWTNFKDYDQLPKIHDKPWQGQKRPPYGTQSGADPFGDAPPFGQGIEGMFFMMMPSHGIFLPGLVPSIRFPIPLRMPSFGFGY